MREMLLSVSNPKQNYYPVDASIDISSKIELFLRGICFSMSHLKQNYCFHKSKASRETNIFLPKQSLRKEKPLINSPLFSSAYRSYTLSSSSYASSSLPAVSSPSSNDRLPNRSRSPSPAFLSCTIVRDRVRDSSLRLAKPLGYLKAQNG